MNQMAVDIEQAGSIRLPVNDVVVEYLVVERLSHGPGSMFWGNVLLEKRASGKVGTKSWRSHARNHALGSTTIKREASDSVSRARLQISRP
jgi:hypothetical protein